MTGIDVKRCSTSRWISFDTGVSHPDGTSMLCSTRCCVTAIWRLPSLSCNLSRVLRLLARECRMYRVISRCGGSTRWSFLGTTSLSGHLLSSWLLSLAHLRYGTLAARQQRQALDRTRLVQFVSSARSLTKGH